MEYCHARIDVSPDGQYLLTAGPQVAILYDGKQWELLFNSGLQESAPKPKPSRSKAR